MFGRLKYGSVTNNEVSGALTCHHQLPPSVTTYVEDILGEQSIPNDLLCVPIHKHSLSISSNIRGPNQLTRSNGLRYTIPE